MLGKNSTAEVYSQIFSVSRQGLTKLPRPSLNSFCSPDNPQSYSPPVSVSQVAGIIDICHQDQPIVFLKYHLIFEFIGINIPLEQFASKLCLLNTGQ